MKSESEIDDEDKGENGGDSTSLHWEAKWWSLLGRRIGGQPILRDPEPPMRRLPARWAPIRDHHSIPPAHIQFSSPEFPGSAVLRT